MFVFLFQKALREGRAVCQNMDVHNEHGQISRAPRIPHTDPRSPLTSQEDINKYSQWNATSNMFVIIVVSDEILTVLFDGSGAPCNHEV